MFAKLENFYLYFRTSVVAAPVLPCWVVIVQTSFKTFPGILPMSKLHTTFAIIISNLVSNRYKQFSNVRHALSKRNESESLKINIGTYGIKPEQL